MRTVKTTTAAILLGAAALAAQPALAETVIKVQSSQAAGDFTFIYMTEVWVPKIAIMSGGDLKMELLPTQSVVPYRETMDAVANGILGGDLTATAYFAGKDAAFAIMGDLIAGYDTVDQVQTFCGNGGGKEILQEMMDTYTDGRVHVIGCGPYAKEALVAKVPIRTVEDFEGVKIRSPEGLAAEVFRRAGATPVALPFSEVYTSLEKGIVDAADASAYVNNDATGMHKIAKFPLYPGIHSMALHQFTINQALWDSLDERLQTILEVWHTAAYSDLRRFVDLQDRALVQKDLAGEGTEGIEIIDWPQEERDKFRRLAVGAWKDYAQQSELAQKAFEAHIDFMAKSGLLGQEEAAAALQ